MLVAGNDMFTVTLFDYTYTVFKMACVCVTHGGANDRTSYESLLEPQMPSSMDEPLNEILNYRVRALLGLP